MTYVGTCSFDLLIAVCNVLEIAVVQVNTLQKYADVLPLSFNLSNQMG